MRLKLLVFSLPVTLLVVALFFTSQYNYLVFHTLVEIFSVAVAWCAFFIAWNAREQLDNNYLLFLGIAYLPIGGIDLFHAMAYKGMGVFPGYGANLPTSLWIAARMFEATALVAAPLFISRSLRPGIALTGCLIAGFGLLGLTFSGLFPTCFIEGVGLTPFKVTSEYVISAALLGAGWLLYRNRGEFSHYIYTLLLGAIGCTIVAEISFTFYVSVYGFSNLVGHLFKLVSFYLIYKGIVETGITHPQELLYFKLQQSECCLRDEKQRYRTVADLTYDWEYWLDEHGNCLYVSPSCERITGYKAREFYAKPSLFDEIIIPEDRVGIMHFNCVNGVKHYTTCTADYRIRTWSGSEVWIGHKCVPVFDEDGKWRGWRGSNRDITEIKAAEELRQDVERISRHDMKGPLFTLINMPKVLRDEIDLNQSQMEVVDLIEESAYDMLNMINLSLDLFKMEKGMYNLNPENVDLLPIIDKALHSVASISKIKRIQHSILINGKPRTDNDRFIVLGEPFLCYSMLANLLSNACQASPSDETIRILMDTYGNHTMVSISNSGEVPESIRRRFFEKYVTFGKPDGTGLGTYSAKLMAETQKGSIDADMTIKGRTTVSVSLPTMTDDGT